MEKMHIEQFEVTCANHEEALELKQEIFSHHNYYFESETLSPRIIDVGAHIGMATLYFKKQYPDARITALEPHPLSFQLLQKNIEENRVYGVELLNVALSSTKATRLLHSDTVDNWYSTSSFTAGAWNNLQKTEPIRVPTVTLSELITEPIDLLKIDIEGAEYDVLYHTPDEILRKIKHASIELHQTKVGQNDDLIEWLEKRGFTSSLRKNPHNYSGLNAALAILEISR
ncbi:FkbM family methyltransferase [Candidatus Woesebacteria bacterium]|nr:FkbM family methyltransferase [Candidatus Woesebacteria bacterium]